MNDLVTVYKFDNGWFIQRIMSIDAIEALTEQPVEELVGQASIMLPEYAIYVLCEPDGKPNDYVVLATEEGWLEGRTPLEQLQWTDRPRPNLLYWTPFVLDAVWAPDTYKAQWGPITLPVFIDDQLTERLAVTEEQTRLQADQIRAKHSFVRATSELVELYQKQLVEAMREPLDQILEVNVLPGNGVGFTIPGVGRLVMKAKTDKGPAAYWAVGFSWRSHPIGEGPTPLDALKNTMRFQRTALFLPQSQHDAWMDKFLMDGEPTVDIEGLQLLGVSSPMVWTDDKFQDWIASTQFGAEEPGVHTALCEEFRQTAIPDTASVRAKEALGRNPEHYVRERVAVGLPPQVEAVPLISPEQLRAQISRVQLLDVRPQDEVSSSLRSLPPLPGSFFVPIDQLEDQVRFTGLDKSRPLVVICKKGLRSGCAVERLYRLGFSNVRSLDGGLRAFYGVQET